MAQNRYSSPSLPSLSLSLSYKHCVRLLYVVQLNEQASEINADRTLPPDPSPLACSTRRRNKRPVSCSLPLEKGETGGVMVAAVLGSCYYSPTFPSLLYPVPMEDDSCKRVEASDKAEITALESCISLYTGVFYFILFRGGEGEDFVAPRRSSRSSGEVGRA